MEANDGVLLRRAHPHAGARRLDSIERRHLFHIRNSRCRAAPKKRESIMHRPVSLQSVETRASRIVAPVFLVILTLAFGAPRTTPPPLHPTAPPPPAPPSAPAP